MQGQGTGFVVFLKIGGVLACLYADGVAPVIGRKMDDAGENERKRTRLKSFSR